MADLKEQVKERLFQELFLFSFVKTDENKKDLTGEKHDFSQDYFSRFVAVMIISL